METGRSLSGIGGIETGSDAAEFLLLGCSTVQVCTGVMVHGYPLVKSMCGELQQFMAGVRTALLCGVRLRKRLSQTNRYISSPDPCVRGLGIGGGRAETSAFCPSSREPEIAGVFPVRLALFVPTHGLTSRLVLSAEVGDAAQHDFESIEQFRGMALPYFTTHSDLVSRQKAALALKKADKVGLDNDAAWTGDGFVAESESMVSNSDK